MGLISKAKVQGELAIQGVTPQNSGIEAKSISICKLRAAVWETGNSAKVRCVKIYTSMDKQAKAWIMGRTRLRRRLRKTGVSPRKKEYA